MRRFLQTMSVKQVSYFMRDQRGATAIEWALIAVGMSIVIITTVFLLGDEVDELFRDVQDAFVDQRAAN